MQSDHELSVEGEAFWRELKIQLEWSERFELFILFADYPTPIHYFEPKQPDTLIVDAFDFLRALENEQLESENQSPIWLEISQYGEDWTPVQTSLIERINERRDRLRKHHPQPFVIVLNGDFSQEVRTIAPDLWSVRCYSRILTPDFLILPKAIDETVFLPVVGDGALNRCAESLKECKQHPKIVEWERLVEKNADGLDIVAAGFDAFNIAFSAGFFQIAKPIANRALDKAQQLYDKDQNP